MTDTDTSHQDVTVMRADSSVSNSGSARSAAGEADAPRVLKQRFVLEEKLGSGGMGSIFRAKDLRKVEARDRQPFLAIKVLNNDFREHPEAFIALQREAAKSQSLSHSNIVSIYDFDKDGDVPFMTMELLEGQELAELLRAYPNGLPDPMAWDVIKGMSAGLKHAHEAGIVHADFKPGNVFVTPSNAPKILDFGIARAVQLTETQGEDTLFDPARLAALTPAYASREMLNGDNPEPRDDLYSFGIVIYLVLTGHHPYGRLSADDAAREGLKPERPKRLSRRQWQTISRCLAFNRQDRPADIAEVEKYLLNPSPWRSRTAIAAVAAFTLAIALSAFKEEAELSEVKQEVRHTTLVDAQIDRINALLDQPAFDVSWEDMVTRELDSLSKLADTEVQDAFRRRLLAMYSVRIQDTPDLDEATSLLAGGERFGELEEARRLVEQRAVDLVSHVLDNYEPGRAWLVSLKQELDRVQRVFPESPRVVELNLEVMEVLEQGLVQSASAGELEHARVLLGELEILMFDIASLEQARGVIGRAEKAADDEARALEEVQRQAEDDEQLSMLLAQSCLRLDLENIHLLYSERYEQDAGRAESGRALITERVNGCVQQLTELDRDRARSLQTSTEKLFGQDMLAADGPDVDPCGLNYLIGNGADSGRSGYCSDRIAEDHRGPRLVVVPGADGHGRFAMTKHEISWEEFSRFCEASRLCADYSIADQRLPVTGVSVKVVQAYANWLSETTGFTYRLPTASEWAWAARGEPDPNRNCRVQLDGVYRGLAPVPVRVGQGNEFGLVHMLGNVQEWVTDGQNLSAKGGAYTDPISECVAQNTRQHAGSPDENTGFRLVREVS